MIFFFYLSTLIFFVEDIPPTCWCRVILSDIIHFCLTAILPYFICICYLFLSYSILSSYPVLNSVHPHFFSSFHFSSLHSSFNFFFPVPYRSLPFPSLLCFSLSWLLFILFLSSFFHYSSLLFSYVYFISLLFPLYLLTSFLFFSFILFSPLFFSFFLFFLLFSYPCLASLFFFALLFYSLFKTSGDDKYNWIWRRAIP